MTGKFTTRPAEDLVLAARDSLREATIAANAADRYSAAHLAALRAAAAVLADRAQVVQGPRRQRIRSAWDVLPEVAPEFAEWAAFFAAGARKRASAQAGIACVSAREADDLVRDAERFLLQVADSLRLLVQGTIAWGIPQSAHSRLVRVS